MAGALAAVARNGLTLLVVSFASFLVVRAMPVDPVRIAAQTWALPLDAASEAALRAQWGIDRPALAQYAAWIAHVARGDWGVSFRTGLPVRDEVLRRLPLSLGLGLGGLGIAVLLAVPLGFAAARRPGRVVDIITRGLAVGAQALPVFWLGLGLIWLFGVHWRLIRPFGDDASRIVLPLALVTFHALGTLTRVFRRDLVESAARPYLMAARAKGLQRDAALWRHGVPQALYAMAGALRAEAGWAVGGTATVEVLFGLPGIGQFLVQSIAARDYPVLQIYVVLVAVWMLAMNNAVAFGLRRLDPRIA